MQWVKISANAETLLELILSNDMYDDQQFFLNFRNILKMM